MAFFPLYFIMDSGYTNEVSVYKLYLLGATPPESLSLWERWHCGAMTERASPAGQSCHAAISRPFVRAMLLPCLQVRVSVLALSVTFGDSSPKGGASDEEGKLHGMRKPLPLGEVALRSNDGEGKPGRTELPCSDKQALCQSDAVAAPASPRQRPCPLSHLR